MNERPWRKASYSGTEQGDCVELADLTSGVGLRDSKAPEAGYLSLPKSALAELFMRVTEVTDD
ncbi:DUF397 domain-containing protein [Spirillospora sp. NPDC049652]